MWYNKGHFKKFRGVCREKCGERLIRYPTAMRWSYWVFVGIQCFVRIHCCMSILKDRIRKTVWVLGGFGRVQLLSFSDRKRPWLIWIFQGPITGKIHRFKCTTVNQKDKHVKKRNCKNGKKHLQSLHVNNLTGHKPVQLSTPSCLSHSLKLNEQHRQ